jgi:hypothetical protein
VSRLRAIVERSLADLYDHDYLKAVGDARHLASSLEPGRIVNIQDSLIAKLNALALEIRSSIIHEVASVLTPLHGQTCSRRKRSLPPKISRVLNDWFQRTQYPSSEEKTLIAELTGLTVLQVITWFGNRRSRTK